MDLMMSRWRRWKLVARCLPLGAILLSGGLPSLPAGALEVVAGTGNAGYLGDGGPAVSTPLNRPQSVLQSADGTLFFSDAGNHRVRAVTPDGVIVTVAGDGNAPADPNWNGASLNFPTGLALDSLGRLWVADTEGQRLLRYTEGVGLERMAGTGHEFAATVTVEAAASPLLYPAGLLSEGESVLWSEMGADRVFRIPPASFFSVIAENIPGPTGLTRDVDGGILVAAFREGAVYRIRGGHAEVAAQLPVPVVDEDPVLATLPLSTSVAVGRDGSLYIAAPDVGVVYRQTPQGELLPFLARPNVMRPVGLWVTADSRLLIADEGRHQVLAEPLPFPAPSPGDLDEDGGVTVNDGVLALRLLVGLDPFHRRRFLASDVAPTIGNGVVGDHRITVEDVVRILRNAVGLD